MSTSRIHDALQPTVYKFSVFNLIFLFKKLSPLYVIIYNNNFILKTLFIILLEYLLHKNIVYAFSAILKELACYTTKVEKKCGTIAMDTYVEILLKIAPKCGRTHGVLPAVIRLYRLEKEEENVVANIFKNRK